MAKQQLQQQQKLYSSSVICLSVSVWHYYFTILSVICYVVLLSHTHTSLNLSHALCYITVRIANAISKTFHGWADLRNSQIKQHIKNRVTAEKNLDPVLHIQQLNTQTHARATYNHIYCSQCASEWYEYGVKMVI